MDTGDGGKDGPIKLFVKKYIPIKKATAITTLITKNLFLLFMITIF